MKRCMFIVILFIALVSTAVAQNGPPEIERILNRGKLIVALHSREQPPFFYTNKKGELDGLDISLARGMAETLGVELEFNRSALSFNDLVTIVANGEADLVISKLSLTMKRSELVKYSTPYITFRQALMVNRLRLAEVIPESELPQYVRDFRGRLGVVANSSYATFARNNFPRADIVEFASWELAVDAVFKGNVLAVYRDELEVKKIIKERPDASLRLKTILLTDTQDDIAIAINWRNTHLLYWVNRYLETQNLNYTADKLLNEYSEIFED